MLSLNAGLFFRLPADSEKRVLRPATVTSIEHDVYTAELEEHDLPVEAGQDLLIYHEIRRTFVQQPAHIEAVIAPVTDEDPEARPHTLVAFRTTGQPVSADSRECYRVSTVMADMVAQVGDEPDCPLLDVSATGFSVLSGQSFDVGSMVDVSLWHEGVRFTGRACVQSLREMSKGRIRYGFHCAQERSGNSVLAKGLQQISLAVQRQHLRRLAGAG
jgi:hypothetical protein